MFGVTNVKVDGLLMFLSFLISLLFEYFPWLAKKYNALEDDKQKAIMFLLILFTSAGSFFFSCIGWLDWYSCVPLDIKDVVINFLLALSVNQSTHKLLIKRETIVYGIKSLLYKF
jgi:uncharacterized membrane protein (DUF106 family)